ncbi:uncharacterized protein LOC130690335 [Daphnia carinata]|uniref:uncharacterized protein LOC130690335 n=1 Tax=Daphnia carinata TaxID=120202 RepID=UPI00257C3DAA|nr:uncharacterized protein LOC130690335 [Daphnia carinata]
MAELISPFLVISVMSYVSGASISQVASSSTFLNQEHPVESHTVPDLAIGLWSEVHSSVNMAWEKLKAATGMQDKEIANNIDQGFKMAQSAETIPAPHHVEDKPVSNQTNHLHTISPKTDESESGECEESTCWTWRVLKIVGIAVGAGFIFSLFSPVLFYFIILNIGYLIYGITFLLMAARCKAEKGSQIGEKLCTACQDIAGSSLQNLFSPFPLFLAWVGSGCLVGWLVWPFY